MPDEAPNCPCPGAAASPPPSRISRPNIARCTASTCQRGTTEIVTLRLEARGRLPGPTPVALPPGSGARPIGTQHLQLPEGEVAAAVYQRATLGAGDAFMGPAIVEQFDATTLVPPGWRARLHQAGTLILESAES